MPLLQYPYDFWHDKTLSGAQLDANFAAITTLINTTKLDGTNFRPITGITNERRANPFAIVNGTVSIKALTHPGDGTTKTYNGLWAWPHYAQFPLVDAVNDGSVASRNTLDQRNLVTVDSVQVVCDTVTNAAAGDTIKAWVYYRTPLMNDLAGANAMTNGVAGNTLVETAVGVSGCHYAHLTLEWFATNTAAARTMNNLCMTVWLKVPHVS